MPSRTFLPKSKGKEISQRILMACMAWFLGLSNSLEPSQCFVCFRDSSSLVDESSFGSKATAGQSPCCAMLVQWMFRSKLFNKIERHGDYGHFMCYAAMQIHILFTPNMLSSRSCDDYQKRYFKCEWVQSSDAIVTWHICRLVFRFR